MMKTEVSCWVLTPLLDQVVGHVEDSQLLHALDPFQLLDQVVGDPQLLQGVGHRFLPRGEHTAHPAFSRRNFHAALGQRLSDSPAR